VNPVTGTKNDMRNVESVDTIGPVDIELGTDASPDGPCKTVAANRTGATRAAATTPLIFLRRWLESWRSTLVEICASAAALCATGRARTCQLYARARVMGSYPEIVAKPNICVTEMPSNAVAVLLRSGRDQPSSWARWTFRRETGSAAYPAPPS
jgi:hypothetical protein